MARWTDDFEGWFARMGKLESPSIPRPLATHCQRRRRVRATKKLATRAQEGAIAPDTSVATPKDDPPALFSDDSDFCSE
nr:Hypothetical protein SC2p1_01890 [Methylocystis sp. SC2]